MANIAHSLGGSVGFGDCQGCGTKTPQASLTFSAFGQQLCRGCFGTYQSKTASKDARRAEEYRACAKCGQVLSPELVMGTDEHGNPGMFASHRRYSCLCGHHFNVLSLFMVAILGTTAAMTAFGAGTGFREGDWETVLGCGGVMVISIYVLLRDAVQRQRYPRVR
jgi:hypothetical protein